ncbi:MAG: GatB/YqeY domain-containing protein [Candidatus Odyssella sp.]|nr:GatB/YqeY domain-containing protein [Candidatus Odyssella sp.]
MLRENLKEALKSAMKSRNERATSTLRLIHAALKDRDIAARGRGKMDGIDEAEILAMLQTMIKQRKESISHFEQGGRLELAQQEQEEIAVIEGFLPKQMGDAEAAKAVAALIAELGAASIKDMGRTMAALRERFAGQMDFTKASALVKQALTK